jgi:hypothetical protein
MDAIWKDLLKRFDANGDGQISKAEVKEAEAAAKAKRAEQPRSETAPVQSSGKGNKAVKGAMALLRFARNFDKIDTNGDGVITQAEFKAYFENVVWPALQAKRQQQGTTPGSSTPGSSTPEGSSTPAPSGATPAPAPSGTTPPPAPGGSTPAPGSTNPTPGKMAPTSDDDE